MSNQNLHTPNKVENLQGKSISTKTLEWVTKNTAILIIHGVGNQLPCETLDAFGRGLIKQYENKFQDKITLEHIIVPKTENNKAWYDNVIRIRNSDKNEYIDLYEYYWANYTEDKASWNDIQKWLRNVVNGAVKYYKKNEELGTVYNDNSLFFKNGKFKKGTYYWFLCIVGNVFMFYDWIRNSVMNLLFGIPYFGKLLKEYMTEFVENMQNRLANVAGDVTVYNVTDPKSKWFDIHRIIQDNAVSAIKYLIEKEIGAEGNEKLMYDSVIVAGHSLGSQIGYDALNKINLMINECEIKNYDNNGVCKLKNYENFNIENHFGGFITFGSPLDKIAFFLRENMPDKMYLRKQILDHYHDFKQRNWDITFYKEVEYLKNKMSKQKFDDINQKYYPINSSVKRFLDNIQWRNYFDEHDYISGSLDLSQFGEYRLSIQSKKIMEFYPQQLLGLR